jgi:hypothetical protein
MPQRDSEFHREQIANHHEVDIAIAALLSAGDEAIHKGNADVRNQRSQRVSENINEANCFQKQPAQIGKTRRSRVRLIIDQASLPWLLSIPAAVRSCSSRCRLETMAHLSAVQALRHTMISRVA